MTLRLIGGVARGLSLPTPPRTTRPTSVQLKRRLFDAWQSWEGEWFVDLCAGVGSMGLEAWSRGARQVSLVESNKVLARGLVSSAQEAKSHYPKLGEIEVVGELLPRWLNQFEQRYLTQNEEQKTLTTVFFDPPYEDHSLYGQVLGHFKKTDWFQGTFIVESDELKGLSLGRLEELMGPSQKQFVQGDSYFALWGPF